ncbi:ABC transporter substrate-binding protein [Corynebacterium sp. TAE3-ERU12]|uniref:siderophore ABC transporter substrate-binding protein n=1 Tax=Corynebacterium sp. TAE3-ERU12 TaxID=2849491 RepID=UPI001C446D3A|nr:ABC transporter substrate-binding protein [Corynebacterium sp. TAE3-ERU12]MBV7295094.1 ABC transporter substrate-binding protein [Corynebacterium sp. TAE3-ERU12]
MTFTLRRSTAAFAALAVTAGSLVACSNDEEATSATDATAEATVDKPAAVLEYVAADTMNTLGIEDQIKGVVTVRGELPAELDSLSDKVADGSITDLGSIVEPKLDTVATVAPEIIFYGRRSAELEGEFNKLAETAINTQVSAQDGISYFESNREQVLKVAGEYDATDAAEEHLAEIDEMVADTKDKAADAGTALFIMTTGGKVSAYGSDDSRYGFVYNELGFAPAGDIAYEGRHGTAISFEEIAEMNPDHVFVLDRDAAIGKEGESAEQVLDNPIFKETNAAKNGGVHYVDSSNWYLIGGGLNGMKAMIKDIQDALS